MTEARHAGAGRVLRRTRGAAAAAAAVLAVALVASLALAPAATRAQTAETVAVGSTAALGDVLVAANGMTLYLFARDTPGVSNCTGQCEQAWPPLTVDAGVDATAVAALTGTLGVTVRADSSRQVTYNGWPLYYYSADSAVGETRGEKVGGVWFAIPTDAANQLSYLTAQDQPLPTANQVSVRVASHSAPFYVVIHEGGADAFGAVIGSSALMPAGLYANVVVPVSRSLANGEYLWPMLHTEDNGNTTYDGVAIDAPLIAGATGNPDFGGMSVSRVLIGEAPAPAPAPVAAATGNAGLAGTSGVRVAWLAAALALTVAIVGGARAVSNRR
ncbi:MAG: hypothetical protein WEB13_01190 [Dehalococcoidia bacterium]